MKIKYPFIIALFLASLTFSQSANLDREYFKVSYVELPLKPILDAEKRTYSSNYNCVIPGYNRINSNGSLDVNYRFLGTEIGEVDIKKTTHEKKDDDGKVISTTYTYNCYVTYTSKGSLDVINSVTPSYNYSTTYKESKNYKSKDFTSRYEAQNYYNDNRYVIRNKERDAHKKEIEEDVSSYLISNYGYSIRNSSDQLWILGKKKHPEYNLHNEFSDKAKEVFKKMKHDELVDGLKSEFKPIIDYFESVIPKYPGTKKKQKKIRYASYYNISKIYYYLDDLEKAKEYAEKLIANDQGKASGKTMLRSVNRLTKLFNLNKVTTRHMKVVTKNTANVVEEKPTAEVEFKGEIVKAYLVDQKNDTLIVDIKKSNIKEIKYSVRTAVSDTSGRIIGDKEVKGYACKELLFLDGTHYKNIKFNESSSVKSGSSLLADTSQKICKVLYESDKIGLYLFDEKETVILPVGAEKGKSTQATSYVFGFKKNLLKLAEGCDALKAKIENKEFKNTAESLEAFCKELSACK